MKNLLLNSSLVLVAILVCLGGLEMALRTGKYDQLDHPRPIWIPPKYKILNSKINLENNVTAKLNPHGFNDQPRNLNKPPGLVRIAILGDSFIWGDGTIYDQIWSHKLEKKVLESTNSAEVHSWGKRGWSTKNEFDFLQTEGVKYQPDIVLIGFVTNDLADLRENYRKDIEIEKSRWLVPAKQIFPNSVEFIASHINRILISFVFENAGYSKWEDSLYDQDNLQLYQKLLEDFEKFSNDNKVKVVFVFTPNSAQETFAKKYQQIIPLFEKANLEVLNLYPEVKTAFEEVNPRDLWANPANGHPGSQLTDLYAQEVFEYLVNNKLISIHE